MTPTTPTSTSPLTTAITRFLDHKRVLGRRYQTEAGALHLFDRYLLEQQIATVDEVTPAVIDAFLRSRPRRRSRSFNHLRGVLARFFGWLVSRDIVPRSPVRTPRRPGDVARIPVIFSRDQVRALVEEAAHLPTVRGTTHRGATYHAILVVLYALGLRVSEVCDLNVGDLDRRRNLLHIRHGKFGKARLVPFGPRVGRLLAQYVAVRRARHPDLPADAPFFSVRAGRPLNRHTIDQVFRQLVSRLNVTSPVGTSTPRVHDLRHTCAVNTLLRWYRTGVDPAARLLHLSTFLGHVQPESTAVYLTITADLLAEASATKRVPPPETTYLDRDEVEALFGRLPAGTWAAERDRALLLFLYNTGARVQEAADLRVGHLQLEGRACVRLHGKGSKWRTCPVWPETARRLQQLVASHHTAKPDDAVFRSQRGGALTRFGLYKIVRRHASFLDRDSATRGRRITPHVVRHSTAVHLLEAGVEVNVIRGWLGHVSLETTNRYAEISLRTKEAALKTCTSPVPTNGFAGKAPWRTDTSLLEWLDSL